MLESSRYELKIWASPKAPDLLGNFVPGHDFNVRLAWDARVWVDGTATSPEALGRLVGGAVQDMAEQAERMMPTLPTTRRGR